MNGVTNDLSADADAASLHPPPSPLVGAHVMPQGQNLDTRPLTRQEIFQVLNGVATADTPPSISSAAFWSTVAGLSTWCHQSDLDSVIDTEYLSPHLFAPLRT